MQYYTGEGIAEFLSAVGLSATFSQLDVAPQVLTYHFNLNNILQFNKIKNAVKMLSMALHQTFEQVESNTAHFGLQVARAERELIKTLEQGKTLAELPPKSILFGFDASNTPISATLDELPHLLIGGTTGSGKSVALNSYITNLCCYNSPDDLGLVLVDLKKCEFNIYERLPHLMCDIINESERILGWLVDEMERRYTIMSAHNTDSNNGLFKTILVVIDELSDLILQNENCKTLLVRLLQKSRASDIHIICATQSPRAKILDGVMLANLPSRICLTCSNVRESILVLGNKGGETLMGKGDAIIKLNGTTEKMRIQVPYISKQDIENLIN